MTNRMIKLSNFSETCLLIIDMQEIFLTGNYCDKVVPAVCSRIADARQKGQEIAVVRFGTTSPNHEEIEKAIDGYQRLIRLVKTSCDGSREIDNDMWEAYMQETNHDQEDVRELLENADDMISIPDLMDFISQYDNIVLTGGGINECLKEVEIALLALNKPFNTLSKFTY